MLDELRDDLVHRDAVGFGAVVDEDAVAQDGRGEGLDVLARDMGATGEQGTGFGAEHEELRRACASPPAYPVVDEAGRGFLLRA